MIVEDVIVMQEILKEILGLKGHSVIYNANNGQDAVDYFLNPNNDEPDIIIIDHRLPVKDGITALKEILSINSQVKAIFISADDSVKEEAIKIGAHGFFVKPITITKVLELIGEISN